MTRRAKIKASEFEAWFVEQFGKKPLYDYHAHVAAKSADVRWEDAFRAATEWERMRTAALSAWCAARGTK